MEFRDLKTQYRILKSQIDKAIQTVLNEGQFIMGRQVQELEETLAEYVGVKHCITCANGTDALYMVLMAWNIKAGDAVFVPDFTFFATGEVVSLMGAAPVFVDVDPATFNIDPVKLEAALQKVLKEGRYQPKAIIPVDLFGLPANYPEIAKIADKFKLLILEDGAQGFGGQIGNRCACSFGNAAITSFFPAKPLGCYGDGGAVFTDDDELAEKIRSIRIHGKGTSRYDNVRIGVNSRLDTMQAAILQVKFQAFTEYELENVNQAAQLYSERLKAAVKTPVIPEGYYSSWAQYTIRLENKEQRDSLQEKLKVQGIPTMIYYPKPMHRQKAFADGEGLAQDNSETGYLCDRVLSLPVHPYLEKSTIVYICDEILEHLGEE
ncbi:MAG: DegT/DnrJ/EryC1/StrS family aminotransferase [Syntrophomonadaceae bacterium]|nr:DegT/DnrJ/EryC1/StrS family aminotransferase [Syntrophomonadaceae bacterium]